MRKRKVVERERELETGQEVAAYKSFSFLPAEAEKFLRGLVILGYCKHFWAFDIPSVALLDIIIVSLSQLLFILFLLTQRPIEWSLFELQNVSHAHLKSKNPLVVSLNLCLNIFIFFLPLSLFILWTYGFQYYPLLGFTPRMILINFSPKCALLYLPA